MNSIGASFKPDAASGTGPKQMEYMPSLKMNDGHEIPMLAYGLGTARWQRSEEEDLVKTTVMAIKNGYWHLDGGEVYKTESHLGEAIRMSGIPRSNLFVSTKWDSKAKTKDNIEASFAASLERLGLDYVDLYLVHMPYFASSPADLQAAWLQMEAIHASGRARSIGVSNFLREDLEAVLAVAKVAPAVNQIEYHPYLQHGDLLRFHRERGIATVAYAPLTAVTKARPGPVDGAYARLAHKYGVTEGEVALRWCIDQGVAVATTSANEERLRSYMKRVPVFKLTPKEIEEIAELGKQKHFRGFWTKYFAEDDRR